MKAFLILCILLASILLSPYSTTARQLADDPNKDVAVTTPPEGRTTSPFKCPPGYIYRPGQRSCVPGKPQPPPKYVAVTTPTEGRTTPSVKCPPGQSYHPGQRLCVPGKPKPSPEYVTVTPMEGVPRGVTDPGKPKHFPRCKNPYKKNCHGNNP